MATTNTYGSNADAILGLASIVHMKGADAQYNLGIENSEFVQMSCFAIAQATFALSCEMGLKSLIAYKSGTQEHPHGHVIPILMDKLKAVDNDLHNEVETKLNDTLSEEELVFFQKHVDHSATSRYLIPSVIYNVLALKKGCETIAQIVTDELNLAYCANRTDQRK